MRGSLRLYPVYYQVSKYRAAAVASEGDGVERRRRRQRVLADADQLEALLDRMQAGVLADSVVEAHLRELRWLVDWQPSPSR